MVQASEEYKNSNVSKVICGAKQVPISMFTNVFLSLKKHARRCGDKPIYICAVLEDEKTKEKLVILNSDGVEITSPHLNVRLVPKAEINPKVCS